MGCAYTVSPDGEPQEASLPETGDVTSESNNTSVEPNENQNCTTAKQTVTPCDSPKTSAVLTTQPSSSSLQKTDDVSQRNEAGSVKENDSTGDVNKPSKTTTVVFSSNATGEHHQGKKNEMQLAKRDSLRVPCNNCKRLQQEKIHFQEKYQMLARDVGRDLSTELAKDETKTENISMRCRPSAICELFTTLSFQSASHIKSIIPKKKVPAPLWEAFLGRLFCMFFTVAAEEMNTRRNAMASEMGYWLLQPLKKRWTENQQQSACTSRELLPHVPLPQEFESTMVRFQRENCQNVEIDEAIIQSLAKRAIDLTVTDLTKLHQADAKAASTASAIFRDALSGDASTRWHKELHHFLHSVCHLCWQMALQQPPMHFETPGIGEHVDPNDPNQAQTIVPKNVNFSQLDRMVVFYYLEPDLVHGRNILTAGRRIVCTKIDITSD